MKNIKIGDKVVIKKGVDKNLEGVVKWELDNLVEVNVPKRAEMGKNSKAIYDIKNIELVNNK